MSSGNLLDLDSQRSVLHWAVERRTAISVSMLTEGRWCSFRSQFLRLDPDHDLLQIAYPIGPDDAPSVEIVPGDELGISFRRGHKKCIFVSPVVLRRSETVGGHDAADTLLIQAPKSMRELQRRAYQRVDVAVGRFVPVKVWQAGVPSPGEPSWPLCAGRLSNISVGGLLVDIRADQNPRLGTGDTVGLEITSTQDHEQLMAEGQYRHCTVMSPGRIGLGFQFLGLEHDLPGRASLQEIAAFVKDMQRGGTRHGRSGRR